MNVLVTYAWCRTAYAAARSLSSAGHSVFVCDPSSLAMTRFSRYVKGYDRVPDPFSSPREFAYEVGRITARRKVEVIVPVHEDALAIQAHRKLLPPSVVVAAPPEEALRQAVDKGFMTDAAAKAGLQTPRTYHPNDLAEVPRYLDMVVEYPVVIKTRRGNSGKGVVIAGNREEAHEAYVALVKQAGLPAGKLPLIQEFVSGKPCGSCFLAREGRIIACFTEEYLRCKERGFGTSVIRSPAALPALAKATERLVATLGWTGIGHIDFILDSKNDEPVFLELNPRFWGALSMAIANGYDFPRALVELVTCGTVDPSTLQPRSQPLAGIWLLGLGASVLAELIHGHLSAPVQAIKEMLPYRGHTEYDDLDAFDPLPFLAEVAYYALSFLRSGFSLNPVNPNMLRDESR